MHNAVAPAHSNQECFGFFVCHIPNNNMNNCMKKKMQFFHDTTRSDPEKDLQF